MKRSKRLTLLFGGVFALAVMLLSAALCESSGSDVGKESSAPPQTENKKAPALNVKGYVLGAFRTNGYLISDRNGVSVFIDPAAVTPSIMNLIKSDGIELKAVLLTHGHIDHVAGLGDDDFLDMLDGEIYMNNGDSKMLTDPPREFARKYGFDFDGISSFKDMKDGDELSFGDIRIKVIATPGHTEGSVCLLVGEETEDPMLFSGDTLFARSVGRTDLEGGDAGALERSLRRLESLPPELAVYPGHGPFTTISDEMESNPYWPK
ncbi:MAG: MBL fold metallo-hydrolase [Synergistaceae bacterium]|nr:MBL fold metallo-hydrolase [Synergistaceae bacterium]